MDHLEAILGHLGTVLDGLGVSWSALGPSWSRLGALLLKMCVLPCEFDDVCRFCRCARRKLAIRAKLRPDPPSPGPLPRGLKPQRKTSITRTSLFPLPGLARNGKSASGTCPRGLTASFVLEPWPPELFTSWFVLEPWGAESAHSTLRTGALASRALYVVVRIWSLGAQRGLTSPFVLEPWRPELFTSSFAFGGSFWAVLEPSWAVLGPFWAVLGRLGGLARHG